MTTLIESIGTIAVFIAFIALIMVSVRERANAVPLEDDEPDVQYQEAVAHKFIHDIEKYAREDRIVVPEDPRDAMQRFAEDTTQRFADKCKTMGLDGIGITISIFSAPPGDATCSTLVDALAVPAEETAFLTAEVTQDAAASCRCSAYHLDAGGLLDCADRPCCQSIAMGDGRTHNSGWVENAAGWDA